MKKIRNILIALIILFVISEAQSQTGHAFGRVILKDTLSGDLKVTSGNIWTDENVYVHGSTGGFLWGSSGYGFQFSGEEGVILIKAKGIYLESPFATTILKADTINGVRVYDDLTVDSNVTIGGVLTADSNVIIKRNLTVQKDLIIGSIFTSSSAEKLIADSDNFLLEITSSLHILGSDNNVSTDRTIILGDGVNVGQKLQIIYQLTLITQCEIENAGNVLTKNGLTRTFDVDRENICLTWGGTYWIEDGRDL